MAFENIGIPLAILAGLLSFASPCVLPLVPIYFGYLTGVTVSSSDAVSRKQVIGHATMFILGFTFVFVTFGALTGIVFSTISGINFRVTDATPWLIKIGGVLLILLGIHMSGALKWVINALDKDSELRKILANIDYRLDMLILPERRMQSGQGKSPGFVRSAVIGMTFAAGWTPCIGPLYGSILNIAANASAQASPLVAVFQSAILLFAYSMGLGIPFFITALILSGATDFLRQINRHVRAIEMVSAVFLIAIGGLLVFGSLSELNQYFSEPPEWLYDLEVSLLYGDTVNR